MAEARVGLETITADALLAQTQATLERFAARPGFDSAEIAAALFLVPAACAVAFPSAAARAMGWLDVPLLCLEDLCDGRDPHLHIYLLENQTSDADGAR